MPAASPRWESIFRGYDIRGRYPQEIDPRTAHRLGKALGFSLRGPFLVGRDARAESESFARGLEGGLRSAGASVERLGIVPTPAVAYLATRKRAFGLAATPSHNPVGYVGLKGFDPSGRLFDREWRAVRDAFRNLGTASRSRYAGPPSTSRRTLRRSPRSALVPELYVKHVTRGLMTDRSVVLDTRGGATALAAPAALSAIGARVDELTRGYSSRFFGRSPEPLPETLDDLARRIRRTKADLGFAFDGDGDRCVALDERGQRVEPEVIGLLLHRSLANPQSPLVASLDASRMLEREVRTVRSRVGGRFVTRAMRRTGAEVGLEPSGHFYVVRYGSDSDGILTACLVCHALTQEKSTLRRFARPFGRFHRGTRTVDFPTSAEARRGFDRISRALGRRAHRALEGIDVSVPEGWCLIRRSNTQPSIRFAFEASGPDSLRTLAHEVRGWADTMSSSDDRPGASR